MTDDAIRAALEAAVEAARGATDPNGCVPPSMADRMAAAIVAFHMRLKGAHNLGTAGILTNEELAAAVERAAQEAGQ